MNVVDRLHQCWVDRAAGDRTRARDQAPSFEYVLLRPDLVVIHFLVEPIGRQFDDRCDLQSAAASIVRDCPPLKAAAHADDGQGDLKRCVVVVHGGDSLAITEANGFTLRGSISRPGRIPSLPLLSNGTHARIARVLQAQKCLGGRCDSRWSNSLHALFGQRRRHGIQLVRERRPTARAVLPQCSPPTVLN
jgi:hypothetical protein